MQTGIAEFKLTNKIKKNVIFFVIYLCNAVKNFLVKFVWNNIVNPHW